MKPSRLHPRCGRLLFLSLGNVHHAIFNREDSFKNLLKDMPARGFPYFSFLFPRAPQTHFFFFFLMSGLGMDYMSCQGFHQPPISFFISWAARDRTVRITPLTPSSSRIGRFCKRRDSVGGRDEGNGRIRISGFLRDRDGG